MGNLRRSPIWSDPRVKPPLGAVKIDWGHPLAANLAFSWLFNEGAGTPYDLVVGKALLRRSAPVWSVGPNEKVMVFNGTSDNLQSDSTLNLTAHTKLAVVCSFSWNAYANDNDLALEFGIATAGGFTINPNTLSAFAVTVVGNVGSNGVTVPRASAIAMHHYVINLDFTQVGNGAEVPDIWIDGVPQTRTGVAANNNTGAFGNLTLNVMARNNTNLFGAGRVERIALYPGRQFTTPEVQWLYSEPYAMFKPIISRRLFVPERSTDFEFHYRVPSTLHF